MRRLRLACVLFLVIAGGLALFWPDGAYIVPPADAAAPSSWNWAVTTDAQLPALGDPCSYPTILTSKESGRSRVCRSGTWAEFGLHQIDAFPPDGIPDLVIDGTGTNPRPGETAIDGTAVFHLRNKRTMLIGNTDYFDYSAGGWIIDAYDYTASLQPYNPSGQFTYSTIGAADNRVNYLFVHGIDMVSSLATQGDLSAGNGHQSGVYTGGFGFNFRRDTWGIGKVLSLRTTGTPPGYVEVDFPTDLPSGSVVQLGSAATLTVCGSTTWDSTASVSAGSYGTTSKAASGLTGFDASNSVCTCGGSGNFPARLVYVGCYTDGTNLVGKVFNTHTSSVNLASVVVRWCCTK